MITGIAHVNLTVPPGTLEVAAEFYAGVLGFTRVPVPVLQKDELAWFDILPGGQQIHISSRPTKPNAPDGTHHPCFKVESPEALLNLQGKIYESFERGGDHKPMTVDAPGENSGAKGVEYPKRFFARDYAGNRLEFSL
ncbi:Glyoxalase/Bleomycin resistance protein/Dihydroxybiphenyl dioxygenase [Calycina marina]|uniref:Glyoxalase/Bleomycin resistance protein/Dihydroxybiphenyl dioxygenase n=1 Tax=Calycina marina TaxID=1763456 RepID=A0A9P7Z153_9HELO|nr:Glyoxalase/Bleomycin resistance protein/Dihydroxybiphenyl dioxygenase [Calycina marina]